MPTVDEILSNDIPQPQPGVGPTVNEILAADQNLVQERAAGLTAVVDSASQEDPERKARLTKWADQLGIPVDAVERNEKYLTGQDRFMSDVNPADLQHIAQHQPRLYQIMQNREDAVMMSDDLKSMRVLQESLDSLMPRADNRPKLPWLEGAVSAARQAQLTTSSLFWAIPSAVAADLAGPDNAFSKQFFYDNWDYLQAERAAQRSFQDPGFVQQGVNALVGSISDPSNLMPAFGAIAGRAAAVGTRAAAPVLGAAERIGADALTAPALTKLVPESDIIKQSLTGAGMMAGAQQAMLNTQQRIQEKAGEGADPYLTAPEIAWAVVDGAFTGWTEKLGGFIAELAPLKPGGIGRVQDVLGDLPKAAVISGSQEFVSTGTQAAQAGELADTGELATSFAIGAAVGGTMQALNTPQAYMERMRREVLEPGIGAATTATKINALAQGMDAAGKSKFKQRAPQRMLATAKAMLGDEAGLSVFFKTEDWVAYWTKQGLNPSEVATRLQGQSEQAGVIGVPVANLMADIAGTDHAAGVLDMAQDVPEGYSLAEARDILAELDKTRKEIDAEFEAQKANPTLTNGVKDDSALLAEQVTQAIAGTDKANEKYARSGGILFGQFYRTLADEYAKAGGKATPLELFTKYGPKIVGHTPGETDRGGYDEATRTLQLLAKGDASTIVHESSHHFLDVYSALASEEGAPTAFQENASSLNKWWSENAQQVADSYSKRSGEKVSADDVKAIADAGLFLTAGKPVDTSALSEESRAYVAGLPAEMQRELGSTIEHLKANPDPKGELGNLKAVVQGVQQRVAKGKRAAPISEGARRAMHEFFARGFEAYIAEGKAPNAALKKMFDSFARWIAGVYGKLRGKNLENKLDVTLTDDARQFMSRLLSTQDAMQSIEPHMAGLEEAAIKSGKMSEQEFAALADATDTARADMRAKMLAKIAKDFTTEDVERRQQFRDGIREEVLAEVTDAGTLEGTAYKFMNDPNAKLSRAEVKATFSPEAVQILEDRDKLAKDGEPLGAAAALYAFPSEAEMVETLVNLRPLDEEVNARLRERENEKFGDPLTPEQMQAHAEQQLFGTDRQKLVARELKILDAMRRKLIEPAKKEAAASAKDAAKEADARVKEAEAEIPKRIAEAKKGALGKLNELKATLKESEKGSDVAGKRLLADIRAISDKSVKEGAAYRLEGLDEPAIKSLTRKAEAASDKALKAALAGDYDAAVTAKIEESVYHEMANQAAAQREQALKDEAKAGKQESKAQAKRVNSIDPTIIKSFVAAAVDKLPIKDMRPGRWRKAAAKYNRNTIEAFAKGDYDAAYLAKQSEIAALERAKLEQAAVEQFEVDEKTVLRYRNSKKLRAELETGGSYLIIGPNGTKAYVDNKAQAEDVASKLPGSRISRGGKVLEFIDNLLTKYDLEKMTRSDLSTRDRARTILEELGPNGPDIPKRVIDSLAKPNYAEVPASEIHDLAVALDNAAAFHHLQNKMMRVQEGMDAAEVRTDLLSNTVTPKKPPTTGVLHDTLVGPTGRLFGTLLRMSTRIEKLDGGKFGKWFDYVLRPLQDANARARTIMNAQMKRYTAGLNLYSVKERSLSMNFKRAIPGTNLKLTHWDRLGIAALWGSETGRQRVTQFLAQLDPQANPQAVLDTLDARDVKYLEDVWAQNESMKVDVEDMYKRRGEKPPEWIEAVPYQAGGKTLSGGYYTISYTGESTLSLDDAYEAIRAGKYANQMTPNNSYTKDRATEVEGKILNLAPEVHIRHLNEVARDLAFRELVRDFDLLLDKGSLGKEVTARFGKDFWAALHDDLKAAVVGPQGANGVVEKTARMLRSNITTASLAFNVWTVLQQPLGITNAMADKAVGPAGMIKGISKVYANPTAAYKDITTRSEFMRDRMNTMDANMHEALEKTKALNITEPIGRYGFKGVAFAQMLIDMPTWYAAYDFYLKETNDENAAIARADQTVRNTMGSGEDTELTALHRNQITRLATLFATYPLTQFNQLVKAGQLVNIKDPKTIARLAGITFWASFLPMVLQGAVGMLKGEDFEPERDETWFEHLAMKQAKSMVDMIPVVRDFSGKAFGESNSALPGALRPVNAAFSIPQDPSTKNFLRAMPLVPVAGIGSLPWGQVGKILDAVEQDNLTPAERIQRGVLGAPFQPRR